MKPRLFLLFSHTITEAQAKDACRSLGVSDIISAPPEIRRAWEKVDPSVTGLDPSAGLFKDWLSGNARKGDYILVQGDYGLTYIMVNYAFSMGCIPVYSTTERIAGEKRGADSRVELKKTVRHVMFRRYER